MRGPVPSAEGNHYINNLALPDFITPLPRTERACSLSQFVRSVSSYVNFLSTMCLVKENESPSPKKEVLSPRSPWAKLLNRQNSKPRLPRRVTSSTRVNLNKCWNKLGELISNSAPKDNLVRFDAEPIVLPFSDFFRPLDPVKPAKDEDKENLNPNGNRFELVPDGVEISENIANEVREICYSTSRSNCLVCKHCN